MALRRIITSSACVRRASSLATSSVATRGFASFAPSMTNAHILPAQSLVSKSQTNSISAAIPSISVRSFANQIPQVGKPAPDFEADAVVGKDFKKVKLSDYKGKYVVLFFYPLDFTFVCPSEILAFNDKAEEFKKINTELLAISVDSKFSHLAWANTPRDDGGLGGDLRVPLISDISHKISSDYGVLIEGAGFTNRGLFIISDKGVLRHITINEPPVGRSVTETLRLVQAFQYTDAHGEVCPIDWTPGKPTIVPNPVKSKEYFKKVNKQ
eukprot:TRINITY_DN13028_c0_g1_i1.p1 TRINITY_DN13028_c0_g1~~TRINITY_DN13028_c0_g1_i1.p1  ORF type:complete len:284 (+),score=83.30 TRINITY_DN13028_c0_g1_i1:47-853(+)